MDLVLQLIAAFFGLVALAVAECNRFGVPLLERNATSLHAGWTALTFSLLAFSGQSRYFGTHTRTRPISRNDLRRLPYSHKVIQPSATVNAVSSKGSELQTKTPLEVAGLSVNINPKEIDSQNMTRQSSIAKPMLPVVHPQ